MNETNPKTRWALAEDAVSQGQNDPEHEGEPSRGSSTSAVRSQPREVSVAVVLGIIGTITAAIVLYLFQEHRHQDSYEVFGEAREEWLSGNYAAAVGRDEDAISHFEAAITAMNRALERAVEEENYQWQRLIIASRGAMHDLIALVRTRKEPEGGWHRHETDAFFDPDRDRIMPPFDKQFR